MVESVLVGVAVAKGDQARKLFHRPFMCRSNTGAKPVLGLGQIC